MAALALAAHLASAPPAAGQPTTPEEVAAIMAHTGEPAYGAYLAGGCAACHAGTGHEDGIPPLAGMPREEFVAALDEYRRGERHHDIMNAVASSLGDEEIAALAVWFDRRRPR